MSIHNTIKVQFMQKKEKIVKFESVYETLYFVTFKREMYRVIGVLKCFIINRLRKRTQVRATWGYMYISYTQSGLQEIRHSQYTWTHRFAVASSDITPWSYLNKTHEGTRI